ncbi:L-threonylcarbamoyladenylate synthase [Ferruginibacter albus]|uniref:L-threonylcarbamoyladenylate synthase n=1 Tax=Ferruginibacter albus TaxID=2875540 RepID=UPI001CC56F83|nr:L-threonylcarbamoyladenylate synthase [Ferruginibacter albus]UAY52824.1 threonylcarbamoyl-AMP synthase [Ferruginibacter albus]
MEFSIDIERCLEVLQNGGTILYPTDTIWGIGCDATNEAAVEKIYRIKKRPDKKKMIILLADEKDLLTYVTQPDLRIFDYIKEIQKPTTVIYEGGIGIADNLINSDGTVAIRIVKEPFCKALIKRFRKPIVSTSANFSDYPSPLVFRDIDMAIKENVDYVVEYRQDDLTKAAPSAIIKWNVDGSYVVIRP